MSRLQQGTLQPPPSSLNVSFGKTHSRYTSTLCLQFNGGPLTVFSWPFFSSPPCSVYHICSIKSWFRAPYHNHTSFTFLPPLLPAPLLTSLFCSVYSRLTPSLTATWAYPGVLSLASILSLPGQWPASAALLWDLIAAVITSGTQALGLPHRWHCGGGGGWEQRAERRKGRFSLGSRQGDVRGATDVLVTAGWNYTASLEPPFKSYCHNHTDCTLCSYFKHLIYQAIGWLCIYPLHALYQGIHLGQVRHMAHTPLTLTLSPRAI